MQVVMDIIGDDKEAQKECFEAYAKMWARLGTFSYLTDSSLMSDVHASNVVREAAKLIKGGGGGQPGFAQAGGKDKEGIAQAAQKMRELLGV